MSPTEKSNIDLYVANRVKELRKEKKISQLKLATEINVSHSFIGQIEDPNHRAKYNIMHINKLAQVFKCSPKDFLPEKAL